jgi:membrane protease YdiL (CAAX protease family)
MGQSLTAAKYGALSGLLWGTVGGLIFFAWLVSSVKNFPGISELGPAILPIVFTFGALLLGAVLAGVGAVFGLLFSKVKDYLPTTSTWKNAVLFYSFAWLIFQLLIRNPSNWLLALASLVFSLLWGASFGYLFERALHRPTKSLDISKYPPPRIVAGVLILSILLLVIGGLISRGLPSFPGFDPSIWLSEWLLVAPPLLLLRRKRLNVRNALSIGRFRTRYALLGFIAAIAIYPLSVDVFSVTETLLGPYSRFLQAESARWFPNSWPGMILWLGGIALSAGISEEILFRGFVQNGLQRNRGPITALIVSATLFGVLHLDPWRIPYAILFGLMTGYLFLRTNSLYTTMTFHIVTNSISSILSFINPPFPVSISAAPWIAISIISAALTALVLLASRSPVVGREPPAPLTHSDRFCAYCGARIMSNARFCVDCGKPVAE